VAARGSTAASGYGKRPRDGETRRSRKIFFKRGGARRSGKPNARV
jgi:hypothetical protein